MSLLSGLTGSGVHHETVWPSLQMQDLEDAAHSVKMIKLPQPGVSLNLDAMRVLPWHEATVSPGAMEPPGKSAAVKAPWARVHAEAKVPSSAESEE